MAPIDFSKFRVFVIAKDKNEMMPVELTEDEMAQLLPGTIEQIDDLPFWKEKIEPVMAFEYQRWKSSQPPPSEERNSKPKPGHPADKASGR